VKDWFEEEEIKFMDWPAQSPDLNPLQKFLGPIDILYTLDSASNYSAIQKLKP
jgi:hypothetical protein